MQFFSAIFLKPIKDDFSNLHSLQASCFHCEAQKSLQMKHDVVETASRLGRKLHGLHARLGKFSGWFGCFRTLSVNTFCFFNVFLFGRFIHILHRVFGCFWKV